MEQYHEELALLETLDTGKPIRHSQRNDIPGAARATWCALAHNNTAGRLKLEIRSLLKTACYACFRNRHKEGKFTLSKQPSSLRKPAARFHLALFRKYSLQFLIQRVIQFGGLFFYEQRTCNRGDLSEMHCNIVNGKWRSDSTLTC